MRLTAKGEYALRLVLNLARREEGKLYQLEEITKKEKISSSYLYQLVKNLKRDGIIISSRGPGGGYALGRPAKEISILQVLASAGEQVQTMSTNLQKSQSSTNIDAFFITLDKMILKKLDKPITFIL